MVYFNVHREGQPDNAWRFSDNSSPLAACQYFSDVHGRATAIVAVADDGTVLATLPALDSALAG